jgi:hypothetical protein
MNRNMFQAYAERLACLGATGVRTAAFELGREGRYSLHYIPFEHVNKVAKLVIVGITPGPNQLELAYETAQQRIRACNSESETLVEVKKHGAFGSKTMRPNLTKMLNHFGFDEILGIDDINSLWGNNAHLLHSTSVLPHAAFEVRKGKDSPFAGDFNEVMGCDLFRECFLDCFVPSVNEINSEAKYIGLGRCPEQALVWCVEKGYLRKDQVIGALSHPATTGGSSVGYFLREKRLNDLSPKDPVRHRANWLDAAYEKMSRITAELRKAA